VHVERSRKSQAEARAGTLRASGWGRKSCLPGFYASKLGRGHEPAKETSELFRRLLEEESHAAAEA
jgi:hypothetical protein